MTKVVFFGNERLVSGLDKTNAPILNGLIDHGYEVVAVVSHHSDSHSRSQRDLEVGKIAKDNNIPLYLPNKPSEIIDELTVLGADIAVLAAYGRIVSQKVIDIFPMGIVNIHPSLLPKYRGPTPIESAMLNGDKETGVSIMQLTAGMDEGPVFAQHSLLIEPDEKKFHLYTRIASLGAQLFFEAFPDIINGSLMPNPQNSKQATYSQLIHKSNSVIDWNKPADQLVREIRAFAGWPQSKATLGAIDVIITDAYAADNDGTPGEIDKEALSADILSVFTIDGALCIDSLKPLGRKEMPIQAFLAGYQSKLGL